MQVKAKVWQMRRMSTNNTTSAVILSIFALLPACENCERVDLSGAIVSLCPVPGDEDTGDTDVSTGGESDGGSAEETGAPTGSESSTGDDLQCDFSEGLDWGPCGESDKCPSGDTCIPTAVGTICAPLCGACQGGQWSICTEDIAGAPGVFACDDPGSCVIECTGDDDCHGGTVCAPDKSICVHPF